MLWLTIYLIGVSYFHLVHPHFKVWLEIRTINKRMKEVTLMFENLEKELNKF